MTKSSQKRKNSERLNGGGRGQAMMEMALILMVLLLLAFGVMDLARVFQVIVVTTNAAREGARFGSEYPMCTNATAQGLDARCSSNMKTVAVNDAASYGISITPSQVTPIVNSANRTVTVTVSYSFATVFGNLFSASPLTISRSATFYAMPDPSSW